jgi:hypothetical protein
MDDGSESLDRLPKPQGRQDPAPQVNRATNDGNVAPILTFW